MQVENHKEEAPFAHYAELFRDLNPAAVTARLSDVRWDGKEFTLSLLGRAFAIAYPDYAIRALDGGALPPLPSQTFLLRYLLESPVRAMEKKGIRTEKGEFNRWIKATNAVIRDIKKKITLLFDWIAEAKAELAKPQAPDLVSLLNAYYTSRNAGAYSQKGKVSNLKEMNETFNYLRKNGIYTLEDLESHVNEHSAATESLKKTLDEQTARMKAIKQLYDSSAAFQSLKPVYDGLQKIKFEKPRAKYKAEHEAELIQFYAARRKLTGEFPDGKVDMKKLTEEYDELEQAHETTYGEFKAVRDDLHRLWKVKSCVDTAARFNEHTEEQKLQNRPQTRHKKEELSR